MALLFQSQSSVSARVDNPAKVDTSIEIIYSSRWHAFKSVEFQCVFLSIWICLLIVFNPISGRLLATPISGRGGGVVWTPIEISGSYRSIFKFKRHSFCLNMIYISKKEFSKIRRRGVLGGQNHEFLVFVLFGERCFFDHVLPARLWTDFDPTSDIL